MPRPDLIHITLICIILILIGDYIFLLTSNPVSPNSDTLFVNIHHMPISK